MPRKPQHDRSNVTTADGPSLVLRLTPNENAALIALVALQHDELAKAGIVATTSKGKLLRTLLVREAKAKGVWPEASNPGGKSYGRGARERTRA